MSIMVLDAVGLFVNSSHGVQIDSRYSEGNVCAVDAGPARVHSGLVFAR